MRQRSGALHCQSEDQFIQLVSNVDTSYGLFYNESKFQVTKKQRKYAISLNNNQQGSIDQIESHKQGEDLFKNFDFDESTYSFKKDCEALEVSQKQFSTKAKKYHYAILTKQNPLTINRILMKNQKLSQFQKQPKFVQSFSLRPPLQLFIDKRDYSQVPATFINCYWIVDLTQMKEFQSLLSIYISTCAQSLNLCDHIEGQTSKESSSYIEFEQLQRRIDEFTSRHRKIELSKAQH